MVCDVFLPYKFNHFAYLTDRFTYHSSTVGAVGRCCVASLLQVQETSILLTDSTVDLLVRQAT